MSVEKALKKYFDIQQSNDFIEYEKIFASKIVEGLSDGYKQGLNEPDLVRFIQKIVRHVNGLKKTCNKPYFRIISNAVFIHGNISLVKFGYYGEKNKQRELGDLIFIVSVWFRGKRYFEKLTINQFKKDSIKEPNSSWKIDDPQLFLLSRFPIFRGINGSMIKEVDYALANYSGCLGSYGLLFKPGDFAFVSASQLNCYLGNSKSLNKNKLYDFRNPCQYERNISNQCFNKNKCLFSNFDCITFQESFGNCHFSAETYDFVQNYLRMRIGETILSEEKIVNPQAKTFLDDLLTKIKTKGEQKHLPILAKFVTAYLQNRIPEYGGEYNNHQNNEENKKDKKGLGIINVTIDLGE